jgi:hypothetical protein
MAPPWRGGGGRQGCACSPHRSRSGRPPEQGATTTFGGRSRGRGRGERRPRHQFAPSLPVVCPDSGRYGTWHAPRHGEPLLSTKPRSQTYGHMLGSAASGALAVSRKARICCLAVSGKLAVFRSAAYVHMQPRGEQRAHGVQERRICGLAVSSALLACRNAPDMAYASAPGPRGEQPASRVEERSRVG